MSLQKIMSKSSLADTLVACEKCFMIDRSDIPSREIYQWDLYFEYLWVVKEETFKFYLVSKRVIPARASDNDKVNSLKKFLYRGYRIRVYNK